MVEDLWTGTPDSDPFDLTAFDARAFARALAGLTGAKRAAPGRTELVCRLNVRGPNEKPGGAHVRHADGGLGLGKPRVGCRVRWGVAPARQF